MKTEIVFVSLLFWGSILRFLQVSGAGVLLTATALAFSMTYLVLGFYLFCHGEIRRQNLALSIISGILLAQLPLAFLFKIQYWQGAGVMVLNGVLSAFLLFVITLLFRIRRPAHLTTYHNRHLLRVSFWLAVALLLYLLPQGFFPEPVLLPGLRHHGSGGAQ